MALPGNPLIGAPGDAMPMTDVGTALSGKPGTPLTALPGAEAGPAPEGWAELVGLAVPAADMPPGDELMESEPPPQAPQANAPTPAPEPPPASGQAPVPLEVEPHIVDRTPRPIPEDDRRVGGAPPVPLAGKPAVSHEPVPVESAEAVASHRPVGLPTRAARPGGGQADLPTENDFGPGEAPSWDATDWMDAPYPACNEANLLAQADAHVELNVAIVGYTARPADGSTYYFAPEPLETMTEYDARLQQEVYRRLPGNGVPSSRFRRVVDPSGNDIGEVYGQQYGEEYLVWWVKWEERADSFERLSNLLRAFFRPPGGTGDESDFRFRRLVIENGPGPYILEPNQSLEIRGQSGFEIVGLDVNPHAVGNAPRFLAGRYRPVAPSGVPLVSIVGCRDFALTNLEFDGNRDLRTLPGWLIPVPFLPGHNLHFSDCRRVALTALASFGACGSGIHLSPPPSVQTTIPLRGRPVVTDADPAQYNRDFVLTDCRVERAAYIGIAVHCCVRMRILGGAIRYCDHSSTRAGLSLEPPGSTRNIVVPPVYDVLVRGVDFFANWKGVHLNRRWNVGFFTIDACSFTGEAPDADVHSPNICTLPAAGGAPDCGIGYIEPSGTANAGLGRMASGVAGAARFVGVRNCEFSYYDFARRISAGIVLISRRAGCVLIDNNTFRGVRSFAGWSVRSVTAPTTFNPLSPHPIEVMGGCTGVWIRRNTWLIRWSDPDRPLWRDRLVDAAATFIYSASPVNVGIDGVPRTRGNRIIYRTAGSGTYSLVGCNTYAAGPIRSFTVQLGLSSNWSLVWPRFTGYRPC